MSEPLQEKSVDTAGHVCHKKVVALTQIHGTTKDKSAESHCTGGLTPHRSPFMTQLSTGRIIHTLNSK